MTITQAQNMIDNRFQAPFNDVTIFRVALQTLAPHGFWVDTDGKVHRSS